MKQEAIIKTLLANEAALEACAYQIAQLSKSNRDMRKLLEGEDATGLTQMQQVGANAGQRFLKNLHRKIAKKA